MTQATLRQGDGNYIDHTPGSAVAVGDVVLVGDTLVCVATRPIAASEKGALATRGVFNMVKTADNVTAGLPLYWDADGDPYGGTAGTGALDTSSATGPFAGWALEDAGTTTGDVDVLLRSADAATIPGSFAHIPVATVAVGGTALANANAVADGFTLVTGADDTAAIRLPAAVAGKICIVKNGVANKILKVFPAANDKINDATANAVYNQTNGAFRTYVAHDDTDWYTDPETIA